MDGDAGGVWADSTTEQASNATERRECCAKERMGKPLRERRSISELDTGGCGCVPGASHCGPLHPRKDMPAKLTTLCSSMFQCSYLCRVPFVPGTVLRNV